MIYTAILGSNDSLQEPLVKGDYHVFSDRQYPEIEGWTQWRATDLFLDNRRNARMHKILMPAKDCLWIDGNILPKVSYDELLEYLGDNDICVNEHEYRKCIYQEAHAVLHYGLDTEKTVIQQIERYKKEGYPENNGMAETGCLLRKDTQKVRELNRLWWEEVCRGSKRDQLSFNYCCWKLGIKYSTFPGHIRTSDLFTHKEHKR